MKCVACNAPAGDGYTVPIYMDTVTKPIDGLNWEYKPVCQRCYDAHRMLKVDMPLSHLPLYFQIIPGRCSRAQKLIVPRLRRIARNKIHDTETTDLDNLSGILQPSKPACACTLIHHITILPPWLPANVLYWTHEYGIVRVTEDHLFEDINGTIHPLCACYPAHKDQHSDLDRWSSIVWDYKMLLPQWQQRRRA